MRKLFLLALLITTTLSAQTKKIVTIGMSDGQFKELRDSKPSNVRLVNLSRPTTSADVVEDSPDQTARRAKFFEEIADAFDAARYGRHFPTDAQVDQWRQALREWESAHPKSAELQHHLEVLRPPRNPVPVDPADQFAERVKRGREAFRDMRSGPGVGPTGR